MPQVLRYSPQLDWATAHYVGRPMPQLAVTVPGSDGFFGNPVRLERDTPTERLRVILAYATWLASPAGEPVRHRLTELAGLDLVCWCAPKPCHADVLIRAANESSAALAEYTSVLRTRLDQLIPPSLFD